MSSFDSIKKFANRSDISIEYKDFLNWNFEKNGFWEKLKSFQPDILLMDLFSDIYFGNLILPDGTYVTRNIRINKIFPQGTIRQTFNDEKFYENLQQHIKSFINRVKYISVASRILCK